MNKRIVITGATGMIGATLTRLFLKEGDTVCAIVRSNSDKLNNLPMNSAGLNIVECELENLVRLVELLDGSFDEFYHFAWNGTSAKDRENIYLQNLNIKNTLDAVKVAKELGCYVFVGAGSQAEYGRIEGVLASDTPTNPETGYGVTKYTAGKLSAIYAKQLNIRHIWTRILSVYGPYDNNSTMVISTIKKLLNREKPSLTKGEQHWDYLYSEDAARAFKLIGEKGRAGSVYCLGSGISRPLKEYIMDIRQCIDDGLSLGIGELGYSQNQVMYLCADIEKLKLDTGFMPTIEFKDGIKNTIEWIEKSVLSAQG